MKTKLAILFSLALLAPAFAQDAAPKGDAANGKVLFTRDGCYQCHGTQGAGASTGPALTQKPTPLPWVAFQAEVRNPVDAMPVYTPKVVSDQELADIYAYTLTFPGPVARSATKGILDR